MFLPAGQVNLHPRDRDTASCSEFVFYFVYLTTIPSPSLQTEEGGGLATVSVCSLVGAVNQGGQSIRAQLRKFSVPDFGIRAEKWKNKDRTVSGILCWRPQRLSLVILGGEQNNRPPKALTP